MIDDKKILSLIKKHTFAGIETIAVRGLDSLDFHDIYIRSLVDLVKKAYEEGYSRGYEEGEKETAHVDQSNNTKMLLDPQQKNDNGSLVDVELDISNWEVDLLIELIQQSCQKNVSVNQIMTDILSKYVASLQENVEITPNDT